jgi:hypothetical protein
MSTIIAVKDKKMSDFGKMWKLHEYSPLENVSFKPGDFAIVF